MQIETTLHPIQKNEPLISQSDWNKYPQFGESPFSFKDLQWLFKECDRYHLKEKWNCLEKAVIVGILIGGVVEIGSMYIFEPFLNSDHNKSGFTSYGYAYNPPFEFHSWAIKENQIFDIALPGAIENGLILKDEHGTFLKHTKPFILSGKPPHYLKYKAYESLLLRNGIT